MVRGCVIASSRLKSIWILLVWNLSHSVLRDSRECPVSPRCEPCSLVVAPKLEPARQQLGLWEACLPPRPAAGDRIRFMKPGFGEPMMACAMAAGAQPPVVGWHDG